MVSKGLQFDIEIFRKEALEMNEENWVVHTSFCGLLDSIRDFCNRMYNDEEIIAQHKKELSSTADVYKAICDHQKQHEGIPHIKYYTIGSIEFS